ncbi:MAG: pyrroline-5-carboxylate reductase [Eubacterium sp.]|jgi:pyrroline-5-carboxylate reductase|nr:pyrroline-5-carboxylate reductase [Eubacterium sp.]
MDNNVGFIGAGNMGTALIKGILKSKSNDKIYVFDIDSSKKSVVESLSENVIFTHNSDELIQICKYVFLAVKPQQIGGLLEETAGFMSGETVLISICAGISDEFIRQKTDKQVKIVLAMPNTPLMLGFGATALSADNLISPEEFDFVRGVFNAVGITEVVPASKMNEIICVNGSSPAFIYLFAQGFLEYAAEAGIDLEAAKELFVQSLIGAAKMISSSGMPITELIAQVSSKGGTTVAGLEKMREGKLLDVVKSACAACTSRAYELNGQKF